LRAPPAGVLERSGGAGRGHGAGTTKLPYAGISRIRFKGYVSARIPPGTPASGRH